MTRQARAKPTQEERGPTKGIYPSEERKNTGRRKGEGVFGSSVEKSGNRGGGPGHNTVVVPTKRTRGTRVPGRGK